MWIGHCAATRGPNFPELRERLAGLTATLLDTEPEAWGLAALLTLAPARAPARTDTPWPPLNKQDTALWDRSHINQVEALLRRAYALGRPLGQFQLEAAIHSAQQLAAGSEPV